MVKEAKDVSGEERHESDQFPIIGIVGPIASGKETVAQILKSNFGIAQFTISDNLKRLAQAKGVKPPYSRELLWDISLKVIDQLGPGGNVKMTEEIIETQRALIKMQGAIIDGIRHAEEAKYLKTIPGSLIIAINAPAPVRFERYLHREKEGDTTFYDEFLRRDNLENSSIEPIYPLADIQIENTGEIEDLEQKVIDFFIEQTNVF